MLNLSETLGDYIDFVNDLPLAACVINAASAFDYPLDLSEFSVWM